MKWAEIQRLAADAGIKPDDEVWYVDIEKMDEQLHTHNTSFGWEVMGVPPTRSQPLDDFDTQSHSDEDIEA